MDFAEKLYEDGNKYYENNEYEKAKKMFLKAASIGNAEAEYWLGVMYYNGKGVKEDTEKANEWFQKAIRSYLKKAKQEDTNAQYSLGYMYENEQGVAKNIEKAIEWYQKAANQGEEESKKCLVKIEEDFEEDKKIDIQMQYCLAMINKDTKKANRWFQKAFNEYSKKAEQKNENEKDIDVQDAYYHLGRIFEMWKKDNEKAKDCYQKAADQGHVEAIKCLTNLCNNFNKNIECTQKYLNKSRGFIYDKAILKSFYLGLQTEQLIVLMGRPGSGKTSLVREFAKIFGISYKTIAVQANWTDKSDLLGYYNPIEQNYISTPFLDCLLSYISAAEKDKDQLYFICLDEMNLSNIEYYFAEFLSALQDESTITLYSQDLYDSILKELTIILNLDMDIMELGEKLYKDGELYDKLEVVINNSIGNPEMDILKKQYYITLYKKLKMVYKFPYQLHIPKNVKFIGTLNNDETTRDISPKVIDRSYVIRFDGEDEFEFKSDDLLLIKAGDKIELEPIIQYKRINGYEKSSDSRFQGFDVNRFNKDTVLKKEIRYSQRIYKQTFGCAEYKQWCEVMSQNEVDDLLLAATVLPRIRYIKQHASDDKSSFKKLLSEALGIETNTYKQTAKIFNSITNNTDSSTDEIIDYWKS